MNLLEEEQKLNKYLKGTTTLGFVCSDGTVLASDTRSTMGYLVSHKEAQKIYPIDEKLAMTTAGLVGDNQTLVRVMKAQAALYKMDGKPMAVKTAATLLSNILQGNKSFPFWVQLILGGYDTEGKIFELDAVGGMSDKKLAATGSGSPIAYGILETEYKEGIPVQDGIKLAVKCIKAAQERDAATGNKIEVVTVTDQGYKKLSEEKVKGILEEFEAKK